MPLLWHLWILQGNIIPLGLNPIPEQQGATCWMKKNYTCQHCCCHESYLGEDYPIEPQCQEVVEDLLKEDLVPGQHFHITKREESSSRGPEKRRHWQHKRFSPSPPRTVINRHIWGPFKIKIFQILKPKKPAEKRKQDSSNLFLDNPAAGSCDTSDCYC